MSFSSIIPTSSYLIRTLRNWPLFFADLALTNYAHTSRHFTYNFRDGTKLKVRPFTTDKWVITDIWRHDPYWHEQYKLSSDPVLVDIGAHIGAWTIHMSRRFSQAKVIAFEPIPATFELLTTNIKLNKLTNTTTINAAVSSQAGSLPLFYDSQHSAYSGSYPRHQHQQGAKLYAPAITLAEGMKRAAVDHIDLLKCDIEGAEFSLLPSLPTEILQRINNVSVEYHLFNGEQLSTLVDFFTNAGFRHLDTIPMLTDSGYVFFQRQI